MNRSIEDEQFTKWLRRPTLFVANAWYLLACAGQMIVGTAIGLLAQLLSGLIPLPSDAAISYTATLIYEIGCLALPVIVYAARHEGVSQSMRLNPPRLSAMVMAIFTAFIGVLSVNLLGTWWMLLIEKLGGTLYSSSIPVPTNSDELTTSILLVGVLPGVCEELMFRGGLMGAWERKGVRKAVWITAILFALLHGSIISLPVQLIMGLVLGYVLLASDSLYVSMIYHTTHNSVILLLSYISEQAMPEAGAAGGTAAEAIAAAGYGSLLIETLIITLLFIMMLRMMRSPVFRRADAAQPVMEGDPSKLNWQELLVLLAALITAATWYINDFFLIFPMI